MDPKETSDASKSVLLQVEADRLLTQAWIIPSGRGGEDIAAGAVTAAKALFASQSGADLDLAMAAAACRADPFERVCRFHTKSIPMK